MGFSGTLRMLRVTGPVQPEGSVVETIEHTVPGGVGRKIGDIVQMNVGLDARAQFVVGGLTANAVEDFTRGEG
jgi:hypothetical protein